MHRAPSAMLLFQFHVTILRYFIVTISVEHLLSWAVSNYVPILFYFNIHFTIFLLHVFQCGLHTFNPSGYFIIKRACVSYIGVSQFVL